MKDVLVIGYGAVGAVYSLILKNSGRATVTVVARSNYEAVRENGMNYQSGKYGKHQGWRPDRLFSNISEALDRPYSYVVLATKAIPEVRTTPALLSPLLSPPYSDIHPQPTYVLLQNGLNVEAALYSALRRLKPQDEPRIISTAVWIGTGLMNKNTIEHNDFDRVSLGAYRPPSAPVSENTPSEEEYLLPFRDILAQGGSEVTLVHEIQRIKFAKNMWNCVLGAAATLTRCSLRGFFRPPHLSPGYMGPSNPLESLPADGPTQAQAVTAALPHASEAIGAYSLPFLHDTLAEVYTLGAALYPPSVSGTIKALDPDLVDRTLANTARIHASPDSTHVPSMLVDALAGRPMEVEHVVGEVVRMGRLVGVAMPRMESIYALLLVMQNQFLRQNHAQS